MRCGNGRRRWCRLKMGAARLSSSLRLWRRFESMGRKLGWADWGRRRARERGGWSGTLISIIVSAVVIVIPLITARFAFTYFLVNRKRHAEPGASGHRFVEFAEGDICRVTLWAARWLIVSFIRRVDTLLNWSLEKCHGRLGVNPIHLHPDTANHV